MRDVGHKGFFVVAGAANVLADRYAELLDEG